MTTKTNDYNASDFIAKLEREAQRDHEIIDRLVERRFVPGIGTVIVTFDTVYDYEYADLSDLGSWSNSASDYAVDAQEGVILGAYTDETLTLSQNDAKGIADTYAWFEKESKLYNPDVQITFDCETDTDGEPKDGWIVAEAIVSGYEILKTGLQHASSRDYDEYFHAERVDTSDPNFLKHIEEDYDRYLSYGNTWSYIGCAVIVYFKGFEVALDSVWGIESDSEKAYIKETFEDLYTACDVSAGIAQTRRDLENKLALLSSKEA